MAAILPYRLCIRIRSCPEHNDVILYETAAPEEKFSAGWG
jgi:hypothetical protein